MVKTLTPLFRLLNKLLSNRKGITCLCYDKLYLPEYPVLTCINLLPRVSHAAVKFIDEGIYVVKYLHTSR